MDMKFFCFICAVKEGFWGERVYGLGSFVFFARVCDKMFTE
jgi:hypothetical protein